MRRSFVSPVRPSTRGRRIIATVAASPTLYSPACEYVLYAGFVRWLSRCGSWEHPTRPTRVASQVECVKCKEAA